MKRAKDKVEAENFAFEVPVSSFLDNETQVALQQWTKQLDEMNKECPTIGHRYEELLAQRRFAQEVFFPPLIARYKALYDVQVRAVNLSGVYAETITPRE